MALILVVLVQAAVGIRSIITMKKQDATILALMDSNRALRAEIDGFLKAAANPPAHSFLGEHRTDGVPGRPTGCDATEQAFVSTFMACNSPHPFAGNRTMVVCSESGDHIVAIGRNAGLNATWGGKGIVADCVPPRTMTGSMNTILPRRRQ